MNDPQALANSLADAGRRLAAYAGEAAALTLRAKSLEDEVGLAKGRLAQKAKVDLFLEELQAEAHSRRVGDFEKLLTALVSEVLPKEAPIGLELEIERGQPSLDIVSRHSVDRTEDIYEDQGGALTNVVSMGLRMIAVVRSGMQRFLMLDESDCWISNERVPAFYSVLKEAARKIDVQCLAVSHHETASFGEGVNVATLSGHPEMAGGVRIENGPRPHRWKPDEKGIRWIRLRNFQGYVDETLQMSPGINALSGENNIGKSSFVRAFRAVFYGEARDSLIRWGERQCVVEIGFPDGRTLHWDRQLRRNPVNCWKLLGEDGAVVNEDGMNYETGGRTVPAWVTEIFRIGPIEGLDVHATKQKTPVFLLDKPGSTRAAVLSVGQESGHIRKMIALQKERCASDAARVKDGELEMAAVVSRLEGLGRLGTVETALATARTSSEEIIARIADGKKFEAAAESLSSARAAFMAAVGKAKALSRLPGPEGVRSLSSEAADVASVREAARGLAETTAALARGRAVKQALDRLPPSAPVLLPCDSLSAAADRISGSASALAAGQAAVSAMESLPYAMPVIARSDEAIRVGKAMKEGRAAVAAAEARRRAFEALPDAMPSLDRGGNAEDALEEMKRCGRLLAASLAAGSSAASSMDACGRELEAAVDEMGRVCPLCNHEISDAAVFLHGHDHGLEAVNG